MIRHDVATIQQAGGLDGYHLVSSIGDLSADLYLVNRMPARKAGTGRIDYTPGGSLYQKRVLVAPLAYATGTITFTGTLTTPDGSCRSSSFTSGTLSGIPAG